MDTGTICTSPEFDGTQQLGRSEYLFQKRIQEHIRKLVPSAVFPNILCRFHSDAFQITLRFIPLHLSSGINITAYVGVQVLFQTRIRKFIVFNFETENLTILRISESKWGLTYRNKSIIEAFPANRHSKSG